MLQREAPERPAHLFRVNRPKAKNPYCLVGGRHSGIGFGIWTAGPNPHAHLRWCKIEEAGRFWVFRKRFDRPDLKQIKKLALIPFNPISIAVGQNAILFKEQNPPHAMTKPAPSRFDIAQPLNDKAKQLGFRGLGFERQRIGVWMIDVAPGGRAAPAFGFQ
jgi:hypothetical protein